MASRALDAMDISADRREAIGERIRSDCPALGAGASDKADSGRLTAPCWALSSRTLSMLSDAERQRYRVWRSARSREGSVKTGDIWVIDADGKPEKLRVELGITDGAMTELLSVEPRPGDRVIIGTGTAPPQTPRHDDR